MLMGFSINKSEVYFTTVLSETNNKMISRVKMKTENVKGNLI